MLRTARLLAVAAVATSTFALAPSAGATAERICWQERVIYTTDYRIYYRYPTICP